MANSKTAINSLYGICALGAILSCAFAFLPERSSGLMASPSRIQSMGLLRQGSVTTVKYTLTNQFSTSAKLLNVGTTCGCTTGTLSKKDLIPGESCDFEMAFDAGAARGSVVARATVVYQVDGEQEFRSLTLQADGVIDPEYSIDAVSLEFKQGGPTRRRVVLRPAHISTLNIRHVSCDKRSFTAAIVSEMADSEAVVEVTYNPRFDSIDDGPAHLIIETDCAKQPVAMVDLLLVANTGESN